jgi:flagellar FliJ protein
LQVLLDLAHQRLEAATAELQRLRGRWQEAQAKHDQLVGYQGEYATALNERLSAGIPSNQLSDFRLFLDKLARAILAQAEEVSRRQHAWEKEHANWLQLREREQALEVLLQRHLAALALKEGKREQKQQDEFALRAGKDGSLRS